jgi:hypothetical protein
MDQTFTCRLAQALTGALLLCAGGAAAGPADYVQVPYIDPGKMVLTLAAGRTGARDGGHETALAPSLGASPTANWFTALYGEWSRDSGSGTRLEAWSWAHQVRLLSAGSSLPFDLHVFLELERPSERDQGYGLTAGPMIQFDTANWQHNLNLLLSRSVRSARAEPSTLAYQWQSKTLVAAGLELGFQGLGTAATWGAGADPHAHQWGPAVFKNWPLAEGCSLRLDGAWLAGLSNTSARQTLRLQARYAF